jgi:hypothetical protein
MAAVDVIAVMNTDEERSLHPFFARLDGKTSIHDLTYPILICLEALLCS